MKDRAENTCQLYTGPRKHAKKVRYYPPDWLYAYLYLPWQNHTIKISFDFLAKGSPHSINWYIISLVD